MKNDKPYDITGIESPLTAEQWQYLHELVMGEMGHAANLQGRGYGDGSVYRALTPLANKCAHQAEIALGLGLIGKEVK